MKISYSVLWLDDQEDYLTTIRESSALGNLKDIIQEWGFEPSFEYVTEPDKFLQDYQHDDFDLLVVDYDLGSSEHGGSFIEKVRNNQVYTEVIFYSSGDISDLWEAVKNRQLEGVFLSDRNGLLSKMEIVAEQSVKKVLDLNNVRGIVMAEVGEIDELLDNLATTMFNTLNQEKKERVLEDYINDVSDLHDKKKQKVETVDSIDDLLDLCESYKKWQFCKSLVKSKNKAKSEGMDGYPEDVLKLRNILAHGIPEEKEGALIFTHKGITHEFTEEDSIKLRKDITKFSGIFQQLYKDFS